MFMGADDIETEEFDRPEPTPPSESQREEEVTMLDCRSARRCAGSRYGESWAGFNPLVSMLDFAGHFHVHDEYSPLDGAGTRNQLSYQAVRKGQTHLGITNHGGSVARWSTSTPVGIPRSLRSCQR